jgi:hypothetical protein
MVIAAPKRLGQDLDFGQKAESLSLVRCHNRKWLLPYELTSVTEAADGLHMRPWKARRHRPEAYFVMPSRIKQVVNGSRPERDKSVARKPVVLPHVGLGRRLRVRLWP